MGMLIRKIEENDLKGLAALNVEIFMDTTEAQTLKIFKNAWGRRINGACLVAEESQQILGAIIVKKKVTFLKNAAYVVSFFVKKEWQGKGVGRKLMEKSLAALKENGYRNVSLTADLDNDRAASLYEKYGFRPYRMLYFKEL
ncbi:GNAT family N-acetyltransferase [Candidatus Micrarchaeota archaeon]|nr:GNAT family N-acetyltransferase [Candidatus Micrarchaeota archaeon]